MDTWTSTVRPVIEGPMPWMLASFVAFIFASTFGLMHLPMNLLIAVLLEGVVLGSSACTPEVAARRSGRPFGR